MYSQAFHRSNDHQFFYKTRHDSFIGVERRCDTVYSECVNEWLEEVAVAKGMLMDVIPFLTNYNRPKHVLSEITLTVSTWKCNLPGNAISKVR